MQSFTEDLEALSTTLTTLESTPDSSLLPNLQLQLSSLHHRLTDSEDPIPPYQIKIYRQKLRSIELRLGRLRKAKPKFSFNQTPPSKSVKVKKPSLPLPPAHTNLVPSTSIAADQSISNQSNKSFSIDDLPLYTPSSSLVLSSLTNCSVDLSSLAFSAVHIHSLSKCVLDLGKVGGSILLDRVDNCVIVGETQQFRAHNSTSSTFLIRCKSKPIIEKSNGIRFGYPPSPASLVEEPIEVQDFDDPLGNSRNWQLVALGEEEMKKLWTMDAK